MRASLGVGVVVTLLSSASGVTAIQTPARSAPARTPSAAFTRLFDAYRRGDESTAILSFARWSEARVMAEALRPSDVDPKDTATLEALAVFHTDAGIASGRFGLFSASAPTFLSLGGWGLEDVFEVHSRTAYTIVNSLVTRAKAAHDERVLQFARLWYIVAISGCSGEGPPAPLDASAGGAPSLGPAIALPGLSPPSPPSRPDAAPDDAAFLPAPNGHSFCVEGLIAKAQHDLKNDPDLLVLFGSEAEPAEMTQAQVAARHTRFDLMYGQNAIWYFDDALKIDPDHAEALLRKGHVLHVARNDPDAGPLFEHALRIARADRNRTVWYLAALFLGEVYEDHGQLDRAVPYYLDAVTAIRAHTASIALGQALVRTGHAAEGWAVGARMFGREGLGEAPVVDPYAEYRSLEYLQIDDRLAELRDMARGR